MSPQFRRQMVLLSPEFFLIYYLGFRLPEHQQKWVKMWKIKYLLQMAPRDHGKSWIFSYGHPIYEIYADLIRNNMESVLVRFLQVSKTDSQSDKYGVQVRSTIESNAFLMEDFGDIRDPNHWLKTQFCCKRKFVSSIEKDQTYEKTGVLGGITGGHFEFINIDDPLDDENTKTVDRMDAIENWFWGTVWNLREPYTRIRVVGTRKNRRDLFNTLIKSPLWRKNVERAIIKYPMIKDPNDPGKEIPGWLYKTDTGRHVRGLYELKSEETIIDVELLTDDYQVLWPSSDAIDDDGKIIMEPVIDQETGEEIGKAPKRFGWGIKELLMDRAGQGATSFDREKQNEISSSEGAIWNRDWFHLFDSQQLCLNDQDNYYYLLPEVA